MRPTDIPDCLAIFARASSGGVSPPSDLLEKLLAEEAASYQVYEGRDPGGRLHLLGFGGTGFVGPAALDSSLPGNGEGASVFAAMWQAEQRGHKTLLRPAEQACANFEGALHLAFLQYADVSPGGSDPLGAHILDLSVRSLFAFRGGYSCKRLFIELDRRDPRFDSFRRSAEIQGCRALSASSSRFQHFELCREDLASCSFSLVSPLFRRGQPRYGFRRGEQRLLQLALLGWSDEEIASELGLALDTVHKRWRNIYERTEDSGHPPWSEGAGCGRTARGPEKRRHLLAHLQHHLEELRPYAKC
jgi:DNA-binding CsgD family transcriptional regulator